QGYGGQGYGGQAYDQAYGQEYGGQYGRDHGADFDQSYGQGGHAAPYDPARPPHPHGTGSERPDGSQQ
ncbi:hypothetical protein NGM37_07800, partial [Streptomyces sp. TRM76130]|nr:hypothetical protein [Streptomyces sp. TRM76130]